ncbi:MAG: polyhydroxyalkanoate synthesis repressor PhaR [Rhodobacteraceae bacterium TMED160]|nr:MAG: polyhydroxyalkanoate synthesis repressor PhaR [Paracoccaceae bacterium]RPF93228.1 MAG: polyhydroxyalkanoate synthesis repressor PhaR [Rhodobacteraceae bacterium TMED160]
MSDKKKSLLIKRYASRRLYNTETSDYVTLEDIARFIHEGRDVQILDLKSGDDLTRQYLLQIIAEHESRGESVLPIDVLTDLVRSYTTQATSVIPQFLEMSFEMLREGQEKMIENISSSKPIPGFEAIKEQQEAFLAAFSNGFGNWPTQPASSDGTEQNEVNEKTEDLEAIKQQLSDLQDQLSKMSK